MTHSSGRFPETCGEHCSTCMSGRCHRCEAKYVIRSNRCGEFDFVWVWYKSTPGQDQRYIYLAPICRAVC